ncbi:hypothetical protein BGY98DRAFT_1175824 [Russula aff. rugulosa BPL654]|nr:hypothetical protein BGY98DRAFT_1175824 [Russula aff. rugulosa BPL654]
MGSDGRGPDRYYNNPYESDDEDRRAANPDHKDGVAKPNDKSDGEDEDGNGNYLVHDNGYDGDMDNDSDSDNDHSEQGSAENMSLGSEPGHPATPERPEHMLVSDLEELSRLRPRNSFGIVGKPKRALQGIVDTKASMVRAIHGATTATSVIGGGAVTSTYDLPVHRQNRKNWILDRLDRRWN